MLETFTLEGVTYSQQYRRCGKPTCATCGNGGPGHGPYWYARDQVTGARSYVGRELPIDVTSARQALNWQQPELYRLRELLRQEAAALGRLMGKEPLSTRDREHIERLGFGSCLVAYRGQRVPQDAGSSSGLLVDILGPALVQSPAPAVTQDAAAAAGSWVPSGGAWPKAL